MPYIYQADVWCDECTRQIKADIERCHPEQVPEDKSDDSTWDSDEWPKEFDDEQATDGPVNCAAGYKCGVWWVGLEEQRGYGLFINTPLTAEGYRYLKKMLNTHGKRLPDYAKEWAKAYGFEYVENRWEGEGPLDWLMEKIVLRSVQTHDSDGGHVHSTWMLEMARTLAMEWSVDRIQDQFQVEMEEDGYFRKTGWYSEEMK
jgi:hypothetical protein